MGPVIVVGSAPCAHPDVADALALFPTAKLCLVNGACTMFEEAAYMVAGHTVKAAEFVKARQDAFPNASPIEVFANWAGPVIRHPHRTPPAKQFPMVTRWFDASHSTGATSAGKAARMMLTIGHEPVILAGCPLDNSGYSFDEAKVKHEIGCRRVGDPANNTARAVINYREAMAKLAAGEFKGKVFSMSGYTRQLLGAPPSQL